MKKNENIILNTKVKDSGGKKIFDEPLLCAQFLRDYVQDIPCFKDIRPEDIEDVSNQFVPLFSEERNADSVKRIHIKNNEDPFFVISLVEHKSGVEYNVHMQILRYMVYIWEAYEKEMESRHEGISHLKSFHYPPILPIVYYEGSRKWDAPLDFRSRIFHGEEFSDYLLNFQYYLVELNGYSNGELLGKKDEISLVMLINKLQSLEDIRKFRNIPTEKIQEIISDSPDQVVKVIADILLTLLLKINVPAEKAEDMVAKVREKKMGQLFENFEPVDIQEEWRKLDIAWAKFNKKQDALNKEQDALNKEQDALNKEQDALNKKQDALNKDRDTLNKAWDALNKDRDEINKDRDEINKDRDDLNKAWDEVNKAWDKVNKARDEINRDRDEVNRNRDEVNRD